MNGIINNLSRIYLTLEIICLLLALFIWQGNFEGLYFSIFIGFVLPSLLLIFGRIKPGYRNISLLAIFFMIYAFLIWPHGIESFWDRFIMIVIAGIVAFIVNPPKEFATGIMLSFWSLFIFNFIKQSPFENVKEIFSAKLFSQLQTFAASPEGVDFITSNVWWVCLIGGFVCSLIPIFLFKQNRKDRYMVIMGLLSLPFLVVPFTVMGIIWGLYQSVNTYLYKLFDNVGVAQSGDEHNSEPAIRKYLFYKAYVDIKNILQESFIDFIGESTLFFRKITTNHAIYGWLTNLYSALLRMTSGITILLAGTVWLMFATVVHLSIIIVCGLPVYVFFCVIRGIDEGYRRINKVKTVCPTCHHQSSMPVYVCPSCNEGHSHLVPGAYGILKRTCNCGEKLPSTFFNGRAFLEAKCSNCHTMLHSKESTPLVIPIIGGPNTGKTCFMISVTQKLIDDVAPKHDWNIQFINENERDTFEVVSMNMQKGTLPAKTINGDVTAFNFFISNQKWQADKMVYFYDPAGEAFNEMASLKEHNFYDYRHGSVFMIDPFSIPNIATTYEKDSTYYSKVNPSSAPLEEIFDRLSISLQEQYGIKPHQKVNKPVAFVINKVDAYDFDSRVGVTAAEELMAQDPSISNIDEAIHKLCQKFLSNAGMNNFLRKIDNKFTNYRFFACSTIKSTPSTSVAKPILWIFSQADKDLKVL